MNEPSETVLEAPARPTLKVVRALIEMKQEEYEQLRETHAELWQKRKSATLDREGYLTYLMVEDRLGVLLHELEALTPQVRYAEAEAAITTGKEHFDSYCEPVAEAATRICQTWASLIEACAAFVQLADQQIALLWSLPDATGQPAFDLPDGQVLLQRMIQAFPHQPATLHHSIIATLRVPMTVGDSHSAVGAVPGTRAFPPTLIRRFLEGYTYEEPKPDMPVEDL